MAGIENIVVVMLENRSFDNMLGSYSGIKPGDYFNLDKDGKSVPNWGAAGDSTQIPAVDPKETFDDMAQQILDLDPVIPDTNPYDHKQEWKQSMGGFVRNYQHQSSKKGFSKNEVMHMFDQSSVPVTTWLAQNFAVCDNWFGSVPTQTFANRMFAQCANPGQDILGNSYINDIQYGAEFLGDGLDLPSVFGQLDVQLGYRPGVANWRLYFHDYSINGRLLNYINTKFDSPDNINVGNYNREDYPENAPRPKHGPPIINPLANPGNTFAEDVRAGTLAPYTFIEPRYSDNFSSLETQMAPGLSPNSNHPGTTAYDLSRTPKTGKTIGVENGERLLLEIYRTLRYSDYWEKTLLIITYDEHGGCFDHVTPPPAVKPGIAKTGGGFDFDYYGPRVPTLIVSPYVTPGSLLSDKGKSDAPYDHTSIIKTVLDNFNPGQNRAYLNAREEAAPNVIDGLDFSLSNNPQSEPSL